MLRTIRKSFALLLITNRLSRAVLRRIALDEAVLADLLATQRIRNRILSNPDIREEFERLIERTRLPGQFSAALPQPLQKNKLPELRAPASALPVSDVAPALNWGPRPFPLTNHGVCLLPGSRYLVERWLRRVSSDAAITLLAHPSMAEAADELAKAYRQIKNRILLPEDLSASPESPDLVAAVIPIDEAGPGLQVHYDLVAHLWHRGCRQFLFSGLAGVQQFEIPFLAHALAQRHEGQRALVLGDDCDIDALDGALLRDEIILAGTRTALDLTRAGHCPSYWLSLDADDIAANSLALMDLLPRATIRVLPLECLPLLQAPNLCPARMTPHSEAVLGNGHAAGLRPVKSSGVIERVQLALEMGCNPVCLVGVSAEEEEKHAGHYEALQQEAAAKGAQLLNVRKDDAVGVVEKADSDAILSHPVIARG